MRHRLRNESHRKPHRRPLRRSGIAAAVGVTAVLWGLVALVALTHGSSDLGPVELVRAWLSGGLDDHQRAILTQARFPRVFFASLVGAALATSGAAFQAVLRNPLADPYILGISGGAALGGTLFLTFGSLLFAGSALSAAILTPAAAFAGAMVALATIFAVSRWAPSGRHNTYVLLLGGVMVNAFAASAIMFLKSLVSAQKAQELLFYLMGALAVEGTSAGAMAACALVIGACTLGICWHARDLNVMSLGDEEAAALGVDVGRTRRRVVTLGSVAVAMAVAFSGIIGFVGLVVPHGARLVVGPDHRILLPVCAFGGAAFLAAADVAARSMFGLFATSLPVGVITSMVGAPLFMLFLWRSLTTRGAI